MSVTQKALIAAASVVILGVGGYFSWDYLSGRGQNGFSTDPASIVADYESLLAETEQLKVAAGDNCNDKNSVNQQIKDIEKRLDDLSKRKKGWLDSVPPLPDVEPELIGSEEGLGRPGSEVPELTSDVPPLPDVEPELIGSEEGLGRPGSEVPELTSDVPPLPDVRIEVIGDSGLPEDYIPDLPEINTGRPGSEVPELTSDVPPLPNIEMDIINPDEYIFKMEDYDQKIRNILSDLKSLCEDEAKPIEKKVISDKCSDACQRHKDCSAFTDDVTPADLNDAYNTCMEECATWPKEMIKCINAIDIKAPNDCVGFLQCQLPQFYEEKYLQ